MRRLALGALISAAFLVVDAPSARLREQDASNAVRMVADEGEGLKYWPRWRGPSGQGLVTGTGYPDRWSATDNVRWKVAIGGEGDDTMTVVATTDGVNNDASFIDIDAGAALNVVLTGNLNDDYFGTTYAGVLNGQLNVEQAGDRNNDTLSLSISLKAGSDGTLDAAGLGEKNKDTLVFELDDSSGGTATDVTDFVHPELAARAVDAAKAVGLDICGIDVIARDIGQPLETQGGVVVEVNAGPGLRMHLNPSSGTPREAFS